MNILFKNSISYLKLITKHNSSLLTGSLKSGSLMPLSSDSTALYNVHKYSFSSSELPLLLCFNCGEKGHLSRDCIQPRNPQQEERLKCFKCGTVGHISTNCQTQQSVCFNCREIGHTFKNCKKKVKKCLKCGSSSHISKDCNKTKFELKYGFKNTGNCYYCGKPGHHSKDCKIRL